MNDDASTAIENLGITTTGPAKVCYFRKLGWRNPAKHLSLNNSTYRPGALHAHLATGKVYGGVECDLSDGSAYYLGVYEARAK